MKPNPRISVLLVAIGLLLVPRSLPSVAEDELSDLGDVISGWRVFYQKRCIDCHAVWGQGAQIGPDLGRTSGGRLSATELAGRMWNHVPRMLGMMKQYRLPEVTLTRAEMADMFSFLYFARYLDEPGDPVLGSRILVQKKCAECHSLEHGGGETGPDLTRWANYVNPIVWAQMMWEHGSGMEKAMKDAEIEWPELGDGDLASIIAFMRTVGTSGKKVYLRPGSSVRGRALFTDHACRKCHSSDGDGERIGPDLARVELPNSLSALASRMWNHQPAMRKMMAEQKVEVKPLAAQEMADIIAYVFAMQYEGTRGNPANGRAVFERKRCVDCHEASEITNAQTGPVGRASPVGMAHAIWQHGATMADKMAEAGIAWPTFERLEMADLIAYLRTVNADGATESEARPAAPSGSK